MSKGIFLYSEDKKYKCAFELCDTLDKYQTPEHSVMILFEEREDGHYVIAEARDKILTTEKDLLIASLELEKSDLVREKADLEARLMCLKNNIIDDETLKELVKEHLLYKDLEAKLAESQNDYLLLEEQLENANDWRKEFQEENKKLKQQLAEKEKSFEWLHNKYAKHIETCNQDKVSFAVEQLEKVKEKLKEDRNDAQALLDPIEKEDYHELIGVVRGYRNSIYEVQKLIAEIKGE